MPEYLSEMQSLIDQIREQLPEETRALTSSSFSELETRYAGLYEERSRLFEENEGARERISALIEENNRIYRQLPTREEEARRNMYHTTDNPHIVSDNTDNPEPVEKVLNVDDLLFGEGE